VVIGQLARVDSCLAGRKRLDLAEVKLRVNIEPRKFFKTVIILCSGNAILLVNDHDPFIL
jgi:hypothetical protein